MSKPTVSIGLPVRNGERYIEGAIQSLLNQSYGDLELIISDNASGDRTREICEYFGRRDSRVRYYRTDVNRGAAFNYNRVFALAEAPYFKWAAHDDECAPEFVAECVKTFERLPKAVVLVAPRAEFIGSAGECLGEDGEDLETVGRSPYRRVAHVVRGVGMANTIFGLIRTDALKATTLIGNCIGADYILLAQLAVLGEFQRVPVTLMRRRIHPGCSGNANPTARGLLSWYKPDQATPLAFLSKRAQRNLQLPWRYAHSISKLPRSRAQRLTCILVAEWVWNVRVAREIAGVQKKRLRTVLASSRNL